jgi:hypothetical protein
LRLPDDAPIAFSLTAKGLDRGGGGLPLKIKKKNKKKGLRLPDDAAIIFSLTATGRGGGRSKSKFKKKKKKKSRLREDAPTTHGLLAVLARTESMCHYGPVG